MIGSMRMERGVIGRLPYLELGSGASMLFVAGLSSEACVEAAGTERMNASLLKPFAKRRRVMFVNRRKGLPRGMSMAEMAEEHAGGPDAQRPATATDEFHRRATSTRLSCRGRSSGAPRTRPAVASDEARTPRSDSP